MPEDMLYRASKFVSDPCPMKSQVLRATWPDTSPKLYVEVQRPPNDRFPPAADF